MTDPLIHTRKVTGFVRDPLPTTGALSLKSVNARHHNIKQNNLKIINFAAFRNCDLQGDLDLPSAYVVADYAFAGNEDLTSISLPDTLQSIGAYAFEDCEKLSQVDIAAKVVKFGVYAFKGCASLTKFDVNTSLIPAGMFYMCKNLTEVTIGPDVNSINEFAFNGTNISNYVVLEGNTAFKVQNEDYIVSADGTQLIAVAPNVRGKITAADFGDNTITTIGRGAFSHNLKITSISLPDVTYVGAYAFGYYDETQPNTRSSVASVTLGKLTYIGEYAFYGTQITEMPNFDANKHWAMAALELAFNNISMKDKNDTKPYLEKLEELTKELDSYISKK